jgi:hypothetical protein
MLLSFSKPSLNAIALVKLSPAANLCDLDEHSGRCRRSIGQTFLSMGTIDPRLTRQSKIDFRLQRQLAAYTKEDPLPNRVKPVPVSVIQHVADAAHASHKDGNLAIADMISLAFFFLFRLGEYTGSISDTSPFRFCDVQLIIRGCRLQLQTAPKVAIQSATFATLTFTTQKNGV